jgi:hypothetical protein
VDHILCIPKGVMPTRANYKQIQLQEVIVTIAHEEQAENCVWVVKLIAPGRAVRPLILMSNPFALLTRQNPSS